VIGNPPYVRQESLGDDKNYYKTQYKVYTGTADLYSYFIEKGISLLRKGGVFSYIVANKWLRARYGKPLRIWLKTQCIEEITDFGDLPVFEGATTYPCIIRIKNEDPHAKPLITKIDSLNFKSLSNYVESHGYEIDQDKLENKEWSLSDPKTLAIFEKIKRNSTSLKNYVDGKIYRGIITGLNKAFIIDEQTKIKLIEKDPKNQKIIKPFAIGRDIKRYQPIYTKKYLIFVPKGWTNERKTKSAWGWFASEFPVIANYLLQYEEKARKRWDQGDYWWELRACNYYDEFEKPKITWGNLATTPKFCMDYEGYYINAPSVFISTSDLYLLGLLNSNLCYYFISRVAAGRRGGFFEYKPIYVSKIPIHVVNENSQDEVDKHNYIIKLVKRMLDLHKRTPQTPFENEQLEREIAATDAQIDRLVYDLYGLTEEEIKIVEEEE